ncbi:MAG: hypothetical protein JW929_12420 [Anaerolineales bacterium]|nr:hypothetical protein [Anaerolineales bacterium]
MRRLEKDAAAYPLGETGRPLQEKTFFPLSQFYKIDYCTFMSGEAGIVNQHGALTPARRFFRDRRSAAGGYPFAGISAGR